MFHSQNQLLYEMFHNYGFTKQIRLEVFRCILNEIKLNHKRVRNVEPQKQNRNIMKIYRQ